MDSVHGICCSGHTTILWKFRPECFYDLDIKFVKPLSIVLVELYLDYKAQKASPVISENE